MYISYDVYIYIRCIYIYIHSIYIYIYIYMIYMRYTRDGNSSLRLGLESHLSRINKDLGLDLDS